MALRLVLFVIIGSLLLFSSALAAEESHKPKSLKELNQSFEDVFTHQPDAWYQNKRPSPGTSASFQSVFPDKLWWEQYNDPYLPRYIESAYHANPDARIAFLRIQEQQAVVKQAFGNLFPSITAGGSISYSENIVSSNGGAASNNSGSAGGGGFISQNQKQRFIQAPLRVSYEVDIWGKYRQNLKAEKARKKVAEYEYSQARLMLASSVATAYFNLIAADAYLDTQQEIVAWAEKDLAAEQAKFKEGLVDRETVEAKQATLAQEKAGFASALKTRETLLHLLANLMGNSPEAINDIERSNLADITLSDIVEEGYPSGLLRRRPDILSAEAQFVASKYDVSAAKRVLFPAITLATQLGYSGIKIGDIVSNNGLLWLLSGSVAQTIFSGWRDWAELTRRKIVAEEILETYRKSILSAFKEVNDAVVSIKTDDAAFQEAKSEEGASAKQAELLVSRLKEGEISGQDTLVSRIALLKAQQNSALKKQALLIDRVSLYMALGGSY